MAPKWPLEVLVHDAACIHTLHLWYLMRGTRRAARRGTTVGGCWLRHDNATTTLTAALLASLSQWDWPLPI
eukprot:357568-Chlamydomonas_euryale.AAC.2